MDIRIPVAHEEISSVSPVGQAGLKLGASQ
jgi:hypothetical protein